MSRERSQFSSAVLVLSGAAGALALAAVAWGVWTWSQRSAPLAPSPAVPAITASEQPDPEIAVAAPAVEPAAPESRPRAAIEPASGTETAAEPPRSAEEMLARRAQESAERLTEQQLANPDEEAEAERERAYMEASFDKLRQESMAMIDGYFAQPEDKRDEYLRKAGEELRKRMEAERLAAGLPAQPRNPGRMWMELMQMNQERMSEEEKARILEFTNDIAQRQMARFRAMMERQLGVEPQPAPPQQ